ncbi:MAG TPA: hypothetical protein H9761_06910 [Candidatus Eisenbergiella merdavium]|uniref:Uncharacterized protein n=1 Tax=Candidatus Eisenbergiella merdavium TaxID=2838551 RepID=A0A9D2NE16_9FIRM|nr:hypothetical protein [Candidatus Eisenbergiella merdavium]
MENGKPEAAHIPSEKPQKPVTKEKNHKKKNPPQKGGCQVIAYLALL